MKAGFSLCSVLPIHTSSMEPSLPGIGSAHPYYVSCFRLQVNGVAQVLLSPWKGELGAVRQGTLEGIWDICLSLVGLMNGVRLPIVTGHQLRLSCRPNSSWTCSYPSSLFMDVIAIPRRLLAIFQFWWSWQEWSRSIFFCLDKLVSKW